MIPLNKFFVVVLIIHLVDHGYAKKSYDGYKLLEVQITDMAAAEKLEKIQEQDERVSFWSFPRRIGEKALILVPPDHFQIFSTLLEEINLPFSITQEDVGGLVKEEEEEMAVQSRLARGHFDLYNFHKHKEINSYLKTLVDECDENPSLKCKKIKIGQSYEGRDMLAIKIGVRKSGKKPAVWLDAGIHAREWIAPATALYIMNKLIHTYDKNNDTRAVLDAFDWYILPSANPDGYEYTWQEDRLWRKTRSPNAGSACVGTDPNRNWDFHWNEAGTSENRCSDIYAGSKPFSEIETKNMADFLLSGVDFKVYLTLHAYGQYWLTPWGYTASVPDDYDELVALGQVGATAIAELYGTEYTVGSATLVLYAAAGSSMDWTKGVANISRSIAAELRDEGYYGFLLPPNFIRPVGKETFNGIRAMIRKVGTDLGYIP